MKNINVYIVVAMILSGCASRQFVQPVSGNAAVLKDMMTKNQCESACWLGIEPGSTDSTVVEGILNKYYGNENVSVSQSDSEGWSAVSWTNTNSQTPPYSGAVVIKDNYVSRIEVYFESLTINDVASVFGEPETVLVAPASDIPQCYGIWGLFYSSTGLELELGQDGVLEKTERVFKMLIFKPLSQDRERAQKLSSSYRMLSWQGYVDYCSVVQSTQQP